MEILYDVSEGLHETLTTGFEPTKARLESQFSIAEEEEFQTRWENDLDSYVKSTRTEITGDHETVSQDSRGKKKELGEERAHQSILQAIRHQYDLHADHKRAPSYYLVLYFLLIAGAMGAYAWSIQLVMPEQNFLIGLLSSIVIASPSYLVTSAYKRSQSRDSFLKWLHMIGLSASTLMILSAAAAKTAVYHLLSSASAGGSGAGFLSASSSSSWLEQLQLWASMLTFIAAIAAEIAFGGRLMILIYEYGEKKKSIDMVEGDLKTSAEKLEKLRAESSKLDIQLARMEAFDSVASSWREATIQELIMLHRDAQDQSEARLFVNKRKRWMLSWNLYGMAK